MSIKTMKNNNLFDQSLIYAGKKIKGMIFNIQRFSIHDGPGIRTTIFFKGCPLRCKWCCNPESQSPDKEIFHSDSKCGKCLICVKECPNQAISFTDNKIIINRDLCNLCGRCIDKCPNGALEFIGEEVDINKLIQEVLSDSIFYKLSGGGVTLSGGEPTYQTELSLKILEILKSENIHTVIETCGYSRWEKLQKILKYTDLVLFDLKLMADKLSKKLTGGTNHIILNNLKKIDGLGKEIIIRIPIIPGYNNSEKNLEAMHLFLEQLHKKPEVNILPFHQLGRYKYEGLGRDYSFNNKKPCEYKEAEKAANFFINLGYDIKVL